MRVAGSGVAFGVAMSGDVGMNEKRIMPEGKGVLRAHGQDSVFVSAFLDRIMHHDLRFKRAEAPMSRAIVRGCVG